MRLNLPIAMVPLRRMDYWILDFQPPAAYLRDEQMLRILGRGHSVPTVTGPHGHLAGVLGLCPALAYLDLSNNAIGDAGTERLAGVLAQCRALVHLDLCANAIGPAGAESLAEVLGQCSSLAHLNLWDNGIGTDGQGRLRASWLGQASGLVLVEDEYD